MCLPKAIPGSISLLNIATYGEVAGLICAQWPIFCENRETAATSAVFTL